VSVASGHSDLQLRQKARKRRIRLMAMLLVPPVLFISSAWQDEELVGRWIETVGTMLIVIAIIGRTWCTLYIGGRKRKELVRTGPYSIVRHPLYLFSLIALAGVGAQTGSIIVALLALVAMGWPLAAVARQEEKVLDELFGAEHAAYVRDVPALIPNPKLWSDVETLEVRPAFVGRTFLEASLMLIAIPIVELVHALQARGVLPVLIRLR
jgi:protein-S-isoprenylcysteine O-methyltransferase Ste14